MPNTKARGYLAIVLGAAALYAISIWLFPPLEASGISNGGAITGTCTNQFVRSITTAVNCATVQNTDLASPSITVNGTTCTLGASCTPSSGISGVIYSQVTTGTNAAGGLTNIVNTTNAQGSVVIAANYFGTVGNVLHVYASGPYSTAATPGTLTIRLRMAATNTCSGTATPPVSQSGSTWKIDLYITVRTTGATGTLDCNSFGEFDDGAIALVPTIIPLTGNPTVDTTGTLTLSLDTQWNGFTGADSISARQLILTQI